MIAEHSNTYSFTINSHTRDHYIQFVQQFRFTHMITLLYRYTVQQDIARQHIQYVQSRIKNLVLGKKSNKILPCLVVFETGTSQQLHVHILVSIPDSFFANKMTIDALRNRVQHIWESCAASTARISETCPDGTSWFKSIDEQVDNDNVARYLTKELRYRPDAIQWDLSHLQSKVTSMQCNKA